MIERRTARHLRTALMFVAALVLALQTLGAGLLAAPHGETGASVSPSATCAAPAGESRESERHARPCRLFCCADEAPDLAVPPPPLGGLAPAQTIAAPAPKSLPARGAALSIARAVSRAPPRPSC